MKTIKSVALTAILSGSLAALSSASFASDDGLPPSTNWQAWNEYVSQPTHSQASKSPVGMPASTNWQIWNKYMSHSSQSQSKTVQNALPSSTNWQQWNQYISTSGS